MISVQGRRQFTRGGPLQPAFLVSALLFQVRHGELRGYDRMLEALWGEAHSFGLELPCEQPVSAQAFSAARAKLPSSYVRELLHEAADGFYRSHGPRMLWKGRRLLAVDGAKRFVQNSPELRRAFGGPDGAHYPQFHLTTLFDVIAKVPLDAVLGPYGSDERVQLSKVLDCTREGDVLVIDAGYPSFDVFVMLLESGLDFVVRVPGSGSFKAVQEFVAGGADEAVLTLHPPEGSVLRGGDPIRLRAVRLERADGPCALLTTLPPEEFTADDVRDAYRLRWEIEEFYKLQVSNYFGQGFLHGRSVRGVEQEIYAQLLFVAIARHLMAAVAEATELPLEHVSQKGAILAVGDHLTRLVLAQPADHAVHHLRLLLERIARARYKPRPGRSEPRRSKLPQRRWGPHGKRSGG